MTTLTTREFVKAVQTIDPECAQAYDIALQVFECDSLSKVPESRRETFLAILTQKISVLDDATRIPALTLDNQEGCGEVLQQTRQAETLHDDSDYMFALGLSIGLLVGSVVGGVVVQYILNPVIGG